MSQLPPIAPDPLQENPLQRQPWTLTPDQQQALGQVEAFLCDPQVDAFILRGSAGTGKTTLIEEIGKRLASHHMGFAVLAPTGRAARILQARTALPAKTIHAHIYAGPCLTVFEDAQDHNDPGLRLSFALRQDEPAECVLIVDEASMVGDQRQKGDLMQFGSGRLLHDLVAYCRLKRTGRSGADAQQVKLLFVGDPAQLPPVGETASPALSEKHLQDQYGLCVQSHALQTVMRQGAGSAILAQATRLRDDILCKRFTSLRLRANGQDMTTSDASGAVALIIESIRARSSSVVVVPTNALARTYNRCVRERVWGDAQAPVQRGDLLLVNKNSARFNLANGDIVKVMETAPQSEKHRVAIRGAEPVELTFRSATVALRDAQGRIARVQCFVLENLLDSEFRELTPLEQRALLVHFRHRHPHLKPTQPEFAQQLLDDPYFNALQVKYGYALTCHKAQGGEWTRVVVDFGSRASQRSEAYFRWVYTAITRASQALVMVSPPDFDEISAMKWDSVGFPSQAPAPAPAPAPLSAPASNTGEDADACPSQAPVQDPDWARWCFSAALAPLFAVHCQLRDAWAQEGICVKALVHQQYCERYVLVRKGAAASVQYSYNGQFKVTRPGVAVPGSRQDARLLEQALRVMHRPAGLASAPQASALEASEPFVQAFVARLRQALQTSSIEMVDWQKMSYRLRVRFQARAGQGLMDSIDFIHDASSKWTGAQEVGGRGKSGGLYEAVQALLAVAAVQA